MMFLRQIVSHRGQQRGRSLAFTGDGPPGLEYPRIVSTDLNSLWLLASFGDSG
jgi:hypothetical protein